MKTLIFKDYLEFYHREDKTINGVSAEFAENNPEYEKQNETNDDCWNALEAKTSTLFAAMQIYKASSSIRVAPTRFFGQNEIALADIKRCAELEIDQKPK